MDIGRQLRVIVVEPEEIELAPAKKVPARLGAEDDHQPGHRTSAEPKSAPPPPPASLSTRRR
jgi:hypothetical protein